MTTGDRVAAPGEGHQAMDPRVRKIAPRHIAVIMDGNGRWANQQGLPRTEGHKAGEIALMDTVAGAVEAGVQHLSMYAFSTENWNRSPAEVKFLMGYSRDVIRRRTQQLHEWGVRVRWVGTAPRLWKSVIQQLREAEEVTADNTGMQLLLCVNYGGRTEIAEAARRIAEEAEAGKLKARSVNEKTVARHLYVPNVPDVDLLIRTSGNMRVSNFLLWQIAYAELDFVPKLWPDFGRADLWERILRFGQQERRFGGAVDLVSEA